MCLLLLTTLTARADESVVNSKHDLSTFGPGPVRATSESQVCIFCHVPHNARPEAPLWNRYNPQVYYRIYQSRTTDARIDQPGPTSKQCLSCHDGTIALGLVRSEPAPIDMTHTFMPTGRSNLTTDLSDDHPIGLRFDRTLANRDPQLRAPQLVDSRIHLGERGELECVACHNPHNNELGNFLRITDRDGALCRTCHELKGWRTSAHALASASVPLTATAGERLPYTSMAENACASCHVSHTAPYRENLLYEAPSQGCLNCHDGLTAQNMLAVHNQRSGHRVYKRGDLQREPEERARGSRYVSCTDCHNPHAVGDNKLPGRLRNQIAGTGIPPAMREVPGVSIGGVAKETADHYYEVCFRCHADRPVLVTNRIIRQRDSGGNVREQFQATAASAHPVAFPSRNLAEVPSLLPEYRTRRYINCQDCHNNPDATGDGGLQPNGPHGSRFEYLLVDRYETADLTAESTQSYALCYRCHERASILGDESFSFHRRHVVDGRSPCSACHTAHGVNGSSTQHSHLINFDLALVGGQRLFVDQGRFRGSCTLTCHGVNHVNFVYPP